MYYEVLVNGVTLGVYGHPEIRNMHLSVMVTEDGPEIFASAVCAENGYLYLYDWLQRQISGSDAVEFRQATQQHSAEPRLKRRMRKDESSGVE
jgi:hypothetical protein